VRAGRERVCQAAHIVQELRHAHRQAAAVRDDRVAGVMRDQRQRSQMSTSCGAR
jgi:hypothetical protein